MVRPSLLALYTQTNSKSSASEPKSHVHSFSISPFVIRNDPWTPKTGRYTPHQFGQGIILYNGIGYWDNWYFTVADGIRVGEVKPRRQASCENSKSSASEPKSHVHSFSISPFVIRNDPWFPQAASSLVHGSSKPSCAIHTDKQLMCNIGRAGHP
jgi:hypothetical protein